MFSDSHGRRYTQEEMKAEAERRAVLFLVLYFLFGGKKKEKGDGIEGRKERKRGSWGAEE